MKQLLCMLCIVCLLVAAVPMTVGAAPIERTLNFAQMSGAYRTLGRAMEHQTRLYMDNVASGFEFYFNGSGDVTLNANVMCNTSNEVAQYFTVVVDGVRSRVRVGCDARNVYYDKQIPLAKGLASGDHHIEVYRQTEASVSLCYAASLTFTGTLLNAPPKAPLTFDVIGDSISGGYGCLWNAATDAPSNGYHPLYQDGTHTYAFLAGKSFGADVRVVQTSGYGCVAGYNGRDGNLQTMYPLLCWWRSGDFAYPFDSPADVVIINLGTNDYGTRDVTQLTNAEFKAGAKNLMQMARQYNPNAKVVWCTGMMGSFYTAEVQSAISELGGADNGYFFLNLPKGMSGAVSHPSASEQSAAADVLKEFLRTTVLPCAPLTAQTDAATLRAAVNEAATISSPSAALQGAMDRARTELNVNTTDPYRLYQRLSDLQAAKESVVNSVSMMPKEHISKTPLGADGVSYVWPYYATDDGAVGLYKGGEGLYWPQINTPINEAVDIDETPYWRLDFISNASFNVTITYRRPDGELAYVKASQLAGMGDNDFAPRNREATTLDFGEYVRDQGHVGDSGLVHIVSCQMFVVGTTDQAIRLYECGFTNDMPLPTTISGSYPVENGIIDNLPFGLTSTQWITAMDHSAWLSVIDKNGNAVDGKVGTGMTLTLTVNGSVADSAVAVVRGDVNGDGEATTTDARLAILHRLGGTTLNDVYLTAADYNRDGDVSTLDAREIMLYNLTH